MRIIDVSVPKSYFLPQNPRGRYIDAYQLWGSQIDDRLESMSREIWKKFGVDVPKPARWPRPLLRVLRWVYVAAIVAAILAAFLMPPEGLHVDNGLNVGERDTWAIVSVVLVVALGAIVLSWVARRRLRSSYLAAPRPISAERLDEGQRARKIARRLFWLTGISFVMIFIGIFAGSLSGAREWLGVNEWAIFGTVIPALALVSTSIISFFFGAKYYLRSQALLQTTAEEIREADPRKPILFLRSFGDDDLGILSNDVYYGFEESISDQMRPFGPLIAVGRPGEPLPSLGASRDYYSDDEWKDIVSNWMDEAFALVILPGVTQGLRWELETIEDRGHVQKLLILMPPVDDVRLEPDDVVRDENMRMTTTLTYDPVTGQTKVARQIRKKKEASTDQALKDLRLKRWSSARNSLIDVPGYSSLPEQPPENLIAVHVGQDRQPSYIVGKSTETDYENAIRTAFYGMFCQSPA